MNDFHMFAQEKLTMQNLPAKIKKVSLRQFTAFENADFDFATGVNVLIGANATGKTHLMKILYSVLKVIRKIHTDNLSDHAVADYFANTIKNIFNIPQIKNFVRLNNSSQTAAINLKYDDISFNFTLSEQILFDTLSHKTNLQDMSTLSSAIYLPSKEFLTINAGFMAAYNHRELPYDETYYDLSLALNALPLRRAKRLKVQNSVERIEKIIIGKSAEPESMITQQNNGHFFFNLPEGRLDVHLVADGFKKIGTLYYLLKNGTLNENSILFWDEPETNLNPKLIVEIVNILKELALSGMQIFIATHDYLLSNELSLQAEYAAATDINIKFFALNKADRESGVIAESGQTLADLETNPILNEFAAHYDREASLFQYKG